ncbi:MAG: hypothetical protein H8E28_07610 [Anaerolineae bacterium]|nr:hypothetical protein [Anaerolineae bacterium]
MRESRGSWYLLTGLIIGVVVGLVVSWMLPPAAVSNSAPDSLRPDYKDAYRALVALAYDATGDQTRANARLALLADDDPAGVLAAQSQRYLAEGFSYNEALALARLSSVLGEVPEPAPRTPTGQAESLATVNPLDGTPEDGLPSETVSAENAATSPEGESEATLAATSGPSPTTTLTRTPIPTFTPLPTFTLTPTLSPPYMLKNQALVCEPVSQDSTIQIVVTNAAGEGVPGVEVIVQWPGGEEHFYTGLKPEMGLGYADFAMTPEQTYTLHIAEGGEPVALFVPECADEGQRYWGGWRLVFTHP